MVIRLFLLCTFIFAFFVVIVHCLSFPLFISLSLSVYLSFLFFHSPYLSSFAITVASHFTVLCQILMHISSSLCREFHALLCCDFFFFSCDLFFSETGLSNLHYRLIVVTFIWLSCLLFVFELLTSLFSLLLSFALLRW